jgi:hypothetical protein
MEDWGSQFRAKLELPHNKGKIDRWRLALSLVKRFPAKYYIDSAPFGEVIIRCKDTEVRLYETSFIVFKG